MARKGLAARVQTLEDIEAIKKLQRAYNYYIEHWQGNELIGLFSESPDTTLEEGNLAYVKGWKELHSLYPIQTTLLPRRLNFPRGFCIY